VSALTIAEGLRRAVGELRGAGCPDPARDARLLLAHAIGLSPSSISLEGARVLTAAEQTQFAKVVTRRLAREPVSHILGYREFWGRRFEVSAAVLDPRPETETIIEAALAGGPKRRVLDLGTGSGCLALTLAAEWPDAVATAVDCSESALAVAARNATTLGVAARATFHQGNWFDPLEGVFDLIVSNPPYITTAEMAELEPDVANWEPHIALTPGGDGLASYREIAGGLRAHLAPGGSALLEFGAGQGPAVTAIFNAEGWSETRLLPDLSGRPRTLQVLDVENGL